MCWLTSGGRVLNLRIAGSVHTLQFCHGVRFCEFDPFETIHVLLVCDHDLCQCIFAFPGTAYPGQVHLAMVRRQPKRMDDLHARLPSIAVRRIRVCILFESIHVTCQSIQVACDVPIDGALHVTDYADA